MTILDIHFLQPLYFYWFILVPFLIYLYIRQERKKVIHSNFSDDIETIFWQNNSMFFSKLFLIFIILSIFILLLANPHTANVKQNITKNGVDIALVVDISTSMDATDIQPNRIEKSKEVLTSFIKKQKTNRVWLVVFAWKPLSSVPLTFDYNIISETLKNLSTDTLDQNVRWLGGTNIWEALLMGKNLFTPPVIKSVLKNTKQLQKKEKKSREKIIILLTDWDPSDGTLDPVLVSKLLAEEHIKIYTIGVWSKEWGMIEIKHWPFIQKAQIPPMNTEFLKKIASISNWHFFKATDNTSLEKIFIKLEELEKNDIEVKIIKNFSEFYFPFIYLLIFCISGLLFLEIRKVHT